MSQFLLSDANVWFSIALGVVLVLFIIELIGLALGIPGLGGLDDLPEPEVAADVSSLASWLNIDKLPLLIWLIVLCLCFGLAGLLTNSLANSLMGSALPLWVSLPLATLLAFAGTARIGRVLARWLPKSESSALNSDNFVGSVANITLGVAKIGSPAEARLVDEYSQPHYVLVEPFDEGEQFNQGERIILVKKGPRSWLATRYK